MNKPPENAEDGNRPEESSSSEVPIIQRFSEPESLVSFFQVFKKIKLMITGDPVTQNSSKAKTQELNHLINDPGAKNNFNTPDLRIETFEQEQFSKSILSIWRTKAENAKEDSNNKNKDKLTNIYPISAAKKNDPKKQ